MTSSRMTSSEEQAYKVPLTNQLRSMPRDAWARVEAHGCQYDTKIGVVVNRAADEIDRLQAKTERLRETLEDIVNHLMSDALLGRAEYNQYVYNVALKALEEAR